MNTKLNTKSAFTIVELLIVIVVIGILAAITIVAYNGIQKRAQGAAATSALNQATKKIAVAQVDSGSSSPNCATFYTLITTKTDVTGTAACTFTNGNIDYQYKQTPNSTNPTGYCITATNGTTSYNVANNGTPSAGGCTGHGSGGVAAITNLAVNPSVETDSVGWSRLAGGGGVSNAIRVSGSAFSGNYSYRQTWTTAPTSSGSITMQNTAEGANEGIPGKTYTFSMRGKLSWAGASLALQIVWYDSSGGIAGSTTTGSPIAAMLNDWAAISVVSVAPANATRARIILQATGSYPSVNSTFDADGLMMTEGNTLYSYADGNSSNWAWSGTINSSTSSGPPL